MPWSVEYDLEFDFLHCVFSGHLTAQDFKESTTTVMAMSKKHKTGKILMDDSKLEIAVSTAEIYKLPLFYDDVKANRRSKIALILPTAPQAREDVQFYETVCRNRGWFIKAFNGRQEAIDWLISNQPNAGHN
jgi:hypothetical protein